MNNDKGNATRSGEAIRKQRKERGLTQSDVSKLIGYSEENRANLSKCENGKMLLEDDQYEILAKEWGLRIDYLKGIDTYPTDDDLENAKMDDRTRKYHDLIRYLSTLGLLVNPKLYFITSVNELIKIEQNKEKYKSLRTLYTESATDYVQKRITHEFRFEDIKDEIREYIELADVPDFFYYIYQTRKISVGELMIDAREFVDRDFWGDYQSSVYDVFPDIADIRGILAVMYEVKYNGKVYALKSAYAMQSFFTYIDRLCVTTIENLLVGDCFTHGSLDFYFGTLDTDNDPDETE